MLHEYAVEPKFLATHRDRYLQRQLLDRFRSGGPAVLAPLPRRWKRDVWASVGDEIGDVERARLVDLLEKLKARSSKLRNPIYALERSWLENALAEDDRCPLHAIVASRGPRTRDKVLLSNELPEANDERWDPPRGRIVPRTAAAFCECLSPMLRCVSKLVVVDPYFSPTHPRSVSMVGALIDEFGASKDAREKADLQIVVSSERLGRVPPTAWEQLRRRAHHATLLPLRVRELTRLPDGEEIHNRYLLTELGGVSFGNSLQVRRPGTTDSLSLLDGEQWERCWNQYYLEPERFYQVAPHEADPI